MTTDSMPYVRPASAKVEELSWGSFAAPRPEIEDWQPDPDSIPVAGRLPDPRLNKEPLTAQQKQALKRDKLLGLYLDGTGGSTRASSPAVCIAGTDIPKNVGSWPAPAPRATGLLRALAPIAAQYPLFSPQEPQELVDTLPVAPKRTLAPACEAATSSKPVYSRKGTMETLAAQPFFQRPSTPPMSVQSQASESPTKTPIPDWARKLEGLFEKEPSEEVATRSVPLDLEPLLYSAPAALVPSVSTPPHRRKQQTSKTSAIPVATAEARINSLNIASGPQDKVQPTAPSTALSPSSLSHLRNVSAATDPDAASLVEKIAVQKRLLDSFIPNKPTPPSDDYERYLKCKLISTMEADMDMPQRTTRRDIKTMNDAELDAHFTKTKGMHKLTWEVQQRKDNIGEMNVGASLAAFQLEEDQRFHRNDGSPGAHC